MSTSPSSRPDIPVPAAQSPLQYLKTRIDNPDDSASDQLTLADTLKDARYRSNAFSHADRVSALHYAYSKLMNLAVAVETTESLTLPWESYQRRTKAEHEAAGVRAVRRKAMMDYWKATMLSWEREGKGEEGEIEEIFAAVVLALVKDCGLLKREMEAAQSDGAQ